MKHLYFVGDLVKKLSFGILNENHDNSKLISKFYFQNWIHISKRN